jgi:putative hydrolases of HD superfamily
MILLKVIEAALLHQGRCCDSCLWDRHVGCSAAIVGDITPHDGYSKDDKFRLELEAMQQIKRILGANPAGECTFVRACSLWTTNFSAILRCIYVGAELESLWLEYEEGATKEAQLVKDFDKVSIFKY